MHQLTRMGLDEGEHDGDPKGGFEGLRRLRLVREER
jgi:hypothetical protein